MTDTLRETLRESLEPAFVLERELEGGGMSRVFVATERRLQRRVVVKVLPPELAGAVSLERFQREIALAAQLQQANIVPVLSAGDVGGLPWYTMPFIEGESLRVRLHRGPLSVAEAIRVLSDIARALAFAHERGVVHRDIKPDNVLLSGGTAVVTDFGIAKAIVDSTAGTAAATLTQAGVSVGTPAYMAPEQIAADPAADHRVDIYALGCVAFELLTGTVPFKGSPGQAMASHLATSAPRLESVRPDVPGGIAELVGRCLEKNPALRPTSATEVLAVLEGVSSGAVDAIGEQPSLGLSRVLMLYAAAYVVVAGAAKLAVLTTGIPDWAFPGTLLVMALGLPALLVTAYARSAVRRAVSRTPTYTPGGSLVGTHTTVTRLAMRMNPSLSWGRTARGGIMAMSVFAAAIIAFMILRSTGVGPFGTLLAAGKVGNEPLLVTDFSTRAADTSLGPVISQAVRSNLEQSSAIRLLSRDALGAALARMRRSAETRVDVRLAREIAEREGLRAIVDGEVAGIGSGFLVTLRLVSADSGKELASFHEPADGAKELIVVVDKLSRKLRGRIGESLKEVRASPRLFDVTTASLPALQKYTAAIRANHARQFARSVALAHEAVALDSNFAVAWRQLSESMRNAQYPPDSINSALARAFALRERVPTKERLMIVGDYFSAGPRFDRGRGIAAYDSLLAMNVFSETNSESTRLMTRREFARIEELCRTRMALEPGLGSSYQNFVVAALRLGHVQQAESVLAAGIRNAPTWTPPPAILARLAYAKGNLQHAREVLEARRDSTGQLPANAQIALGDLAALEGRLRDDVRLRTAAAARDQRPYRQPTVADTLSFILRAAYLLGPSPGLVARVDAAVSDPAFMLPSPNQRLYIRSALAYAKAGAPQKARAMLRRFELEVRDTAFKRSAMPQLHTTLGTILMAEGKPMEAAAEFRLADRLPDGPANECLECLSGQLAVAYDAAGMVDSARVEMERYLTVPAGGRMASDMLNLAHFSKRLGEIYEQQGNIAKARYHYTTLVTMWAHADPELRPTVAEVRRRLARLGSR